MAYQYEKEIRHNGLNKYRIVKGSTSYEVEQKANAVLAQWEAQWQRQLEREAKTQAREAKIQNNEDSMQYAAELTAEAEETQAALDSILVDSLSVEPLDIENQKQNAPFSKEKPFLLPMLSVDEEPQPSDSKYHPQPTFLIKMFKSKMQEFEQQNHAIYLEDHHRWELDKEEIESRNARSQKINEDSLKEWQAEKAEYEANQAAFNQKVDDWYESFKSGNPEAVEVYISSLLERIEYPFDFNIQTEIEYSAETNSVIIDVQLPTVEDLPNLQKVTYIKAREEFKKTYIPANKMNKKYENVIYQIVLQLLNYIYSGVEIVSIDAVTINGKISTIDKATGNNIEPYILSVCVTRENFNAVNLAAVDPKAWFKSAKGVSAASIANITPIAPIITMSREDHRFIEGYAVADAIDESVNLAAMDWQDFENLIREIFEQEFNFNGGEVKITQASRDGGVDAVAFDPDPIRGGKIVIQAKRYTNVVGVSAVRDLYGTVMNEGANKGILVTTSNFGNDAYQFAQGKPLTLMDGANLLYLLEKHGHKAKIDIKEAKKTLNQSKE